MTDVTTSLSTEAMGTFDAEGNYVRRQIITDDLSGTDLDEAMVSTIVEFDDGDLVEGTVVKIDRDEVLVDIGLRGFIPASLVELRRVRELQPYVGRVIELDQLLSDPDHLIFDPDVRPRRRGPRPTRSDLEGCVTLFAITRDKVVDPALRSAT